MSISYSEIYTTNLRAQSQILKGEKTLSTSKSKYARLIKNFSKNKRAKKFKPRSIKSKSIKILKINYFQNPKYKNSIKNQQNCQNKKGKQENKKYSKNLKSKRINYKDNLISKSTEYNRDEMNNKDNLISKSTEFIRDEMNHIDNLISKSTKFNRAEKNNKELFSENDENNIIKKFMLENKNNYLKFNTLQNNNAHKNYVKLSKTYNNNYIQNYFDIFRLKQYASNFRDKIKNYSLNNQGHSNYNFTTFENTKNKKYLKTHINSNFNFSYSKTFFKANKLREEIENTLNNKNKINFRPYSSYNIKDDNKNILFKEKNEDNKNIEIINNINYQNNYIMENNDLKELTFHYFDKSTKQPKRIKKYINKSQSNKNNFTNDIANNSFNEKDLKNKNRIIKDKNAFRKKSNISINKQNDRKLDNQNIIKNNHLNKNKKENILKNDYISGIKVPKNEIKIKNLSNITLENIKLTNLLRKIPSTRTFKNKSSELMDYILQLRKFKNNFLNNLSINNDCLNIYPVNECGVFINLNKIN